MDRMEDARLARVGLGRVAFGRMAFGVARTARALRALARVGLAALLLGAVLATAAPGMGMAEDRPGVVNVNTATVDELVQLPGIGEKRAQAILEARQQRGGFKSVDELLEIRGIGPANLEKLRPHLSVSGKSGAAQ